LSYLLDFDFPHIVRAKFRSGKIRYRFIRAVREKTFVVPIWACSSRKTDFVFFHAFNLFRFSQPMGNENRKNETVKLHKLKESFLCNLFSVLFPLLSSNGERKAQKRNRQF